MTSSAPRVASNGAGPAEGPILRIDDMGKVFARRGLAARLQRRPVPPALSDIRLEVGSGESLGIVGESGSGKTTLARSIVGLVRPDTGTLEIAGRDVATLPRAARVTARRKVQLVFQDPVSSLNPVLTVRDAIAEPALVHKLVPKANVDARVAELMDRVGLGSALTQRRPAELSGGQCQRVAIARALAAEPEILIADEAVSALDVSIQAQVINLFAELRDELHLTLMFVSHQLATVAQLCERVAIMYRGRIVELGPTEDVFHTPRHGYTVALLRAQPGAKRKGAATTARTGPVPEAPPLTEPGCPFRHRCMFRAEVCQTNTPTDVVVDRERIARCHVLPRLSTSEVQAYLRQ